MKRRTAISAGINPVRLRSNIFGVTAAATAEELSETLAVIIALRTTITVRV
jgi:hypothetical protein